MSVPDHRHFLEIHPLGDVLQQQAATADAPGTSSALVRRALKGDVAAARRLLHMACNSLQAGTAPPAPVAAYLGEALAAYLSGRQPAIESALNLVPKPSAAPEINARVPVCIKRLRRIRVDGCGVRTSPVVVSVRGSRHQSYLVARIYLRMKLHGLAKAQAVAWVARRYRIAEEGLIDCDRKLDAIGGWSVQQLKTLIRLAR